MSSARCHVGCPGAGLRLAALASTRIARSGQCGGKASIKARITALRFLLASLLE